MRALVCSQRKGEAGTRHLARAYLPGQRQPQLSRAWLVDGEASNVETARAAGFEAILLPPAQMKGRACIRIHREQPDAGLPKLSGYFHSLNLLN